MKKTGKWYGEVDKNRKQLMVDSYTDIVDGSTCKTSNHPAFALLLLAGTLLLLALAFLPQPALAATPITTCAELQNIRNNLAGDYYLANDIDCSGFDYGDGKGFMPIGTEGTKFTGTFDGKGHKITHLYINRPSTNDVGLFGCTGSGSEIKDVGLEEVDVSGNSYVGGLVGDNLGTITNSYSSGSVSGSSDVGGLVGGNDATITNSYSSGSVSGSSDVGGLVGANFGTITNSYSSGSVSGDDYVGGLVGFIFFGTITNSYSSGSVSGDDYVGGLVGASFFGTITNSYSSGSVSGSSDVGGLVGGNDATITNSYWDIFRSGQSNCVGSGSSSGCTGKNSGNSEPDYWYYSTHAPMDQWDFDNIWGIVEGITYPYLRWQYPGISVNKVANPIAGASCTDVTFTITITNTGECTLNPVKVVDTLPAGMSYVSSSPKGSVVGNTITWANVGPLGSGNSTTISLVAHIDEGAAGMLENVVTATGTPAVTDTATADVTVLAPDISVTKEADPTSGAPCTDVTFTITVTNTGDCTLNPVTVVDTLPTGIRYISDDSGGVEDPVGTITWALGSMASDASTTIHLTAHIDEGASGTLTDSVTATGSPPHGDDVEDIDTADVTALVPGISVEKTANPTEGAPSTNVEFTITVTNTGDCTLDPVTVVDTLPAGMSYVSDDSGGVEDPVRTISWDLGSKASGASTTIHLTAHIDEGASGTLTDSVTATGSPPHGDDVEDTDTADVTALVPGISVEKTANLTEGAPSTNVEFTITVTNTGDCTLDPVTVVDTLPAGMSYVSDDSGGVEDPVGTISWDLGSKASGASTTIHLTAHIDEGASGTLTDSVTATGSPPHGDDVEDIDTADVTALVPGISVTKVADPPDVAPSSNVEFTITFSNTGDCTLDPVRVVDTLSAWMSYVSSSPAADTHDGTIIWNNVGPLDPRASKTISLVARIASDASGTLTNAVTVTGTSSTGEEVTDSDTVTVTVLARTIEPPTQTLIDVTTEIKSDRTVIEGEQFGWMTGNGNLLNNPPLSPGEAVGGIKYDDKMIGSNGTTEFTKNFGVNTNVTPNLAVTKDIGYKSGDLGSLSYDEQVGMRYSGASPPLSSTTRCEDVNAYSKMVVTDVEATTETEVGITETDERDLHYGINAEGKGSVSAGVDASASSMSYKDKSNAYGGNFSLHKNVDYTSKPSTSIATDLKGDSTVVEEGQFRGKSGNKNLKYNEKMIGSNGTTEFEKCVDASTTNLAVDKSIGYKSGDLGSLSYDEQVGMRYSSTTKCEDVNAYGKMVVTNATTETEVGITGRGLYYGIDAKGTGSVAAGVDASAEGGRTDMAHKDKSDAHGNFTFSKEIGYNKPP